MFDKRKEANEPAVSPERASPTQTTETPTFNSRSSAMIGKTIKIKGSISGDENLIIEGTVDGSIDLPKNDLTIGESGHVTANLTAKVIKVDGQVTGDMSGSEKVVVSKTGRVKGNIIAPRVTLEDGAKFKGSIDMDPGENTASSAPPVKSNPAPQEVKKEAS
jgi:cytoskeletal protein CcmA (bactofilin family)